MRDQAEAIISALPLRDQRSPRGNQQRPLSTRISREPLPRAPSPCHSAPWHRVGDTPPTGRAGSGGGVTRDALRTRQELRTQQLLPLRTQQLLPLPPLSQLSQLSLSIPLYPFSLSSLTWVAPFLPQRGPPRVLTAPGAVPRPPGGFCGGSPPTAPGAALLVVMTQPACLERQLYRFMPRIELTTSMDHIANHIQCRRGEEEEKEE
ncbi:unnamed protein product [Lampetra fluviatilis]